MGNWWHWIRGGFVLVWILASGVLFLSLASVFRAEIAVLSIALALAIVPFVVRDRTAKARSSRANRDAEQVRFSPAWQRAQARRKAL